jgi:hypothetical protein
MDVYRISFFIPKLLNYFLTGDFSPLHSFPLFKIVFLNEIGVTFLYSFNALAMFFSPLFLKLMGKKPYEPEQFAIVSRSTRIILPA